MQNNICSFAGHANLSVEKNTRIKILNKCCELVENYGVNEFWVGKYGAFDRAATGIIKELRKKYSIELNLVIPYLTKEFFAESDIYLKTYNKIIVADIPDNTPKKYRILKCNQYMVNNSKYIITCVNHSYGGAAKTLEYAKKNGNIKIFNFGEL